MTTTTKRNLFLFAVGIAIAAVIIVTNQPGTIPATSPIDTAVETCDVAGNPHVAVLDGGHTLTVHGDGDTDPGLGYEDVACVLAETGVTGAVIARMDRTRALDGTQDATWGDYMASWTYHPDAGLNVLITWADA
jgi:hypothetical protein